jgi:hypothetical protein
MSKTVPAESGNLSFHREYSTQTGELKAGKNNKVQGSKGRVKVIFYPSNKAK